MRQRCRVLRFFLFFLYKYDVCLRRSKIDNHFALVSPSLCSVSALPRQPPFFVVVCLLTNVVLPPVSPPPPPPATLFSYGLLGPNGAGKTTLMRNIANGAIDGLPTELRTVFVQHDIVASDVSTIVSQIACLPSLT